MGSGGSIIFRGVLPILFFSAVWAMRHHASFQEAAFVFHVHRSLWTARGPSLTRRTEAAPKAEVCWRPTCPTQREAAATVSGYLEKALLIKPLRNRLEKCSTEALSSQDADGFSGHLFLDRSHHARERAWRAYSTIATH